MGADLDVCELHLTIKNGITQQPYVTADGLTSLDMPYESCEWTDIMYEAKVAEIPTAKIVLPSLIAFPELRPLQQLIQEGDRVELYANQPDCGDPVLGAFIPPNGITEDGGKTSLDVQDTQVQLRWQHLRRFEYLTGPASVLYDRARMVWQDQVAEDFTGPLALSAIYNVSNTAGAVPILGSGFVRLNASGTAGCTSSFTDFPSYIINPGDVFLMECDASISTAFSGSSLISQVTLWLQANSTNGVGGFLEYWPSGAGSFPQAQVTDFIVNPTLGANYSPGGGTNQVSFSMPQSHHFAVYVRFNLDGTASLAAYLDNVNVAVLTRVWHFDSLAYEPQLALQSDVAGDSVTVTSWRVRKLMPALNRAGRFNPQTVDAFTYQPNHEENLQFLQLIAEKDNSEYRPIYRAWPVRTDELELDAVGTLGNFASRILGYEQPPRLPTEGSPQPSPAPVITDQASFLIAPPFRFEEGYNLESTPKINPKANAHANDVIRVGASSIDSQVFAEKWSVAEVGRPQYSNAGNPRDPAAGAKFPYFEQITNDDRVGIQGLITTLAGFEVSRRIDPTPSLEVAYVEEVQWAFRWRAGDQVFTKTLSLRNNLEQEMRVQKIRYKAGSPVRTVTLGKTDWDPTMLRMLSESMKISWLYEQSGTNPGIYVYPSLGNILSGATSPVFSIPLDQYTTGSALVYAALHWFADANVMNIQPQLNGGLVYTTGLAGASGTDSGLVTVTQYFQAPGTFQLAFKNNDGSTRNLTGAFLVLRIKA